MVSVDGAPKVLSRMLTAGARPPALLRALSGVEAPEPQPLFRVVEGGIIDWEVGTK